MVKRDPPDGLERSGREDRTPSVKMPSEKPPVTRQLSTQDCIRQPVIPIIDGVDRLMSHSCRNVLVFTYETTLQTRTMSFTALANPADPPGRRRD